MSLREGQKGNMFIVGKQTTTVCMKHDVQYSS
jgi:hypothetical protein